MMKNSKGESNIKIPPQLREIYCIYIADVKRPSPAMTGFRYLNIIRIRIETNVVNVR